MFSDPSLITGNLRLLRVGAGSFIGRVPIAVHDAVTIGNHVCINDGAKLLTASHDIRHPEWPSFAKPIVIEDYAWIATDALILPGVIVGRGSVAGAAAVITKDVPDRAVAAGNPATIHDNIRPKSLSYSPTASLALMTAWKRIKH